jgi:lipoate-protein ligase A
MIHWRYITADGESASRALASDEFLMSKYAEWSSGEYPEPMLRIYTLRSHCVIAGRFQNLEAEIDLEECRRRDIDVNRRITGGGAIVMGSDQLTISLASSTEHPIVPAHPGRMISKLSRGLIVGLAKLGIDAEFRSKNDIVVDGRKIGGTAICIAENGALLYQANVMLDFDVDLMLDLLAAPFDKSSKEAVDSFRERLTTVAAELNRPVSAQQAREAICRGFEQAFKMSAVHAPFTPMEIERIEQLERERYLSDAWPHQRQPAKDMQGSHTRETPDGIVRVYVALLGDTLKNVLITGDFFSGNRVINDIEAALKWGRTEPDSIARTIRVVMSNNDSSIQGIGPVELADIVTCAITDAVDGERR